MTRSFGRGGVKFHTSWERKGRSWAMIPFSRFAISICNGKRRQRISGNSVSNSGGRGSYLSRSLTDSTGEFPKCLGRPRPRPPFRFFGSSDWGRIFKGPIDRGIRIICSGIYPTVTGVGDDDGDRDRLGSQLPVYHRLAALLAK